MAVYLTEYLKKFANEKKLDWPGSRDTVVWRANKDLEADRTKLDEVWKSIIKEFHDDVAMKRIKEDELEAVKKKIRQAI